MKRPEAVVVTCEHASNAVPRRYHALFRGREADLRTHRAYDLGAARAAAHFAEALGAPLFSGQASRLLVDLNRSKHHPRFFSEAVRSLPPDERARVVREHYDPHRGAVEDAVKAALGRGGRVLHLAVHSFTPVLDRVTRTADVGFLYDPGRPRERALCAAWREALRHSAPWLRVRRNYPYRGVADGFTTALRRVHGPSRYAGVEVELNQAMLVSPAAIRRVSTLLLQALGRAR